MYTLAWSSGFKRAFKKVIRKNPHLEEKIFLTLEKLVEQPFNPELKTHKLHGKLAGLWAFEVEYDCRIVFTFEKEPTTGEDIIVLADIGTHDEVY
jgi:addiction module RelE/StbE family toxin